jgi:predicted nucleic acid-binding protein
VGKVVLDASVILALFDPQDTLHDAASQAMRHHRQAGAQFVLPATVLAEILVGAARRGRDEVDTRRKQAVAAFGTPAPVDEAVAVAAAMLRATHRVLRLPDALVLATAAAVDADTVLTGDKTWQPIDPRVELIVS